MQISILEKYAEMYMIKLLNTEYVRFYRITFFMERVIIRSGKPYFLILTLSSKNFVNLLLQKKRTMDMSETTNLSARRSPDPHRQNCGAKEQAGMTTIAQVLPAEKQTALPLSRKSG